MATILTDLLQDVVREFATLPPFAEFVDPDLLLVVGTRGRPGPEGRRAACHFTRFRETNARVSRDGVWECPEIRYEGREMRYVISFVLPRFLFLSREEQAEDVIHELLHVDRSFSGVSSPLRHGRRYHARVRSLAAAARERGLAVPPLGAPGDLLFYRRFRPFPQPYRRADRRARRVFDERDLEVAALRLDPRDREAPPPRYLYRCPSCGEQYKRQRPLVSASCGACAPRYDRRFALKLVAHRDDAPRRPAR